MQQFKIRQDGYSEIKRQSLKKSVPVILVAVVIGVGISFTTVTSDHFDLNTLFIVVAIIILSVAWGIKRGLNRIKNLFESYTLIITDSLVSREQANTPTVSLYFNEIKDILRLKNGSFIIKGEDRSNTITISSPGGKLQRGRGCFKWNKTCFRR